LLKERKREIPNLPQKIGIITSRQGAVLADFLSNIGHYGFKIKMIDSRVEGQSAVTDLLSAIKTIKKKNIEVLVIMRGGGSFESLQPFNNELLIREIANFPVPVIAAIGHDKDMPLVSLVADLEVSTPSIAAITLSKSWREAIMFLEKHERNIFDNYGNNIKDTHDLINQSIEITRESSASIIKKYKDIKNNFRVSVQIFKNTLLNIKDGLKDFWSKTLFGFSGLVKKEYQQLEKSGSIISAHNPERQLNLGYSIASINGKIVKSVEDATAGNNINLMVTDGTIISQIKNINKKLIK
jgi:exodeoxyribonuclease VII large subunit